MKNRRNKGEYGYRDYRRKVRATMATTSAAAVLIQLVAKGPIDNQAAGNILAVMVVLSVLPTANLALPLLASWRYRAPSEALYRKVRIHEGEFTILYDLIVTAGESILPFDAVIIHPNGTYTYYTANKVDSSKAKKSLDTLLKGQKLDGNLEIIKDERGFFHRMEGLKPAANYEDDGNADYVANFLKNMSM